VGAIRSERRAASDRNGWAAYVGIRICQGGGKLCFPVAHHFMAEHDATDGGHLGQIAQGELVAKAPEHHEGDNVGRVLGSVQQAAVALVDMVAALTAADPAVALRSMIWPLGHRVRAAFQAPYLPCPAMKGRLYSEVSSGRPEPLAQALTHPSNPKRLLLDAGLNRRYIL